MIAVCPNPYRDRELNVTKQVLNLLHGEGCETCVCPLFLEENAENIPKDFEIKSLKEQASKCSLIIVIGGDGTILSAVRELGTVHVPILGVNLGTIGFMSTVEIEELHLILNAVRNDMKVTRHMMLDVELKRGDKVILKECALNDVVIHGHGDCIKVTSYCGDKKMISYSGDGIILSTPTGSTGYSMSAGGPIAEPDSENIIVSPVCAHTMGSRPFVLSPDRVVSVKAEKYHGKKAYLSMDGIFACDLENGDIITARKSENYTLMADPSSKSFYDIVNEKLR